MNYPANYYFTREHEWVNFNGDIAWVGLTELALQELGIILKIEITSLGQFLKKEQVFGRVQSERYLTKLIMPFNGTVTEVNTDLFNNINEVYFHNHWLVKLKISQPVDKSNLFSLDQYKSYKSVNLLHMIKYLNKNK
jgi:glycine cleavage system H protein